MRSRNRIVLPCPHHLALLTGPTPAPPPVAQPKKKGIRGLFKRAPKSSSNVKIDDEKKGNKLVSFFKKKKKEEGPKEPKEFKEEGPDLKEKVKLKVMKALKVTDNLVTADDENIRSSVTGREIMLRGVPSRCLLRQTDGSVGFFAMRPDVLESEKKQAMAQKVSDEAVFQVNTRVKHPKHGAGVVTELMEDGRTRVVFDDGEEHRYKSASMHKLSAELGEVGTRVVHPKHGLVCV